MSLAATEVPDLLKDVPAGAWVAISEEQETILAFGSDLEAVLTQAQQRGEPQPLIVRKPAESLSVFL